MNLFYYLLGLVLSVFIMLYTMGKREDDLFTENYLKVLVAGLFFSLSFVGCLISLLGLFYEITLDSSFRVFKW